MDFPIAELVEWLHPDGFACPRCHEGDRMRVHRSRRPPVLDYRCGHCGRVFNAFTGTALHGGKRGPVPRVLIVRGFAQGVPTAQWAREWECDRSELLNLRHHLQDLAFRNRDPMPRDDKVLEADEAYQNAGEKRVPPKDPEDPLRRRANQVPGHGTWENDRPPVCGVVGRESGLLRLNLADDASEHR
jgi:transposase-like protein